MLIPVHRVPNGLSHAKGRKSAVLVAHAIVDDEHVHLADDFWTMGRDGYAKTWRNGQRLFLHHAVIGRVVGKDVSHENANKLDCRRINLVHRYRSANMLNPVDGPNCRNRSSGIRGVARDDRNRALARPWRGKVAIKGRTYQTSRYATAKEAETALIALRARLNAWPSP